MLDGLLGRSNFYSKCKSLIKQTRTRIEVVRRKRNARQKFLRKDIADLLANRLDVNAFARAEALIAELILTSCYDFIDHVCEIVLKHLPVLEKLRECPEECREAVASLMFAAARLSDLPELRDLRDLFHARYGSSVEFYVNQKLVDNITVKPPTVEKKIQLLQEIALEFSIRWDSKKFLEMMSDSSTEQKVPNSPGTVLGAKSKVATPPMAVAVQRTVKDEVMMMKPSGGSYRNMYRHIDGRGQMGTHLDSVPDGKDVLKHKVSKSPEFTSDKNKPPSYREETTQKLDDHISFQRREHKAGVRDLKKNCNVKDAVQIGTSSHGRRLESVDSQHKRGLPNTLSQQKLDLQPTTNGINLTSPVTNELPEDGKVKPMRKQLGDVADGPKPDFRGGIPPPYMKPRKSKHKIDEENDTLTFNPGSNGNKADKLQTKADNPDITDGTSASEETDGPARFTEIYYKDEATVGLIPRRRSHRRRHSRSGFSQDNEVNGEERVIRRVSTSRRKNESKKGLQILVGDDDHNQKDEEERMIDKLLLHYCKKPTSVDPGVSRRKTSSSKSPHHRSSAVDESHMEEDLILTKSRSFCVPSRQVTEPKQEKVFARAASFDQDTPVKHVHPKLPDYDDLAARFAALRAAKG